MKTYIQSNVLKGPLYNLDRILKNPKHQKILVQKLNYCIAHEQNLAKAIDVFADYLTEQLFGLKASKLLLVSHEGVLESMTGHEYVFGQKFRILLKKIIKRNFKYNPRTGANNLKKLSSLLIEDINIWLNEIMGAIESGVYNIKFDNLFVRKILYFVIRSVMEGVALRWVIYGKNVDIITNKVFREHTKSFDQFKAIVEHGLKGCILFRGQEFYSKTNLYGIVSGNISLAQGYDSKNHLKKALNYINNGFFEYQTHAGTSWSTDYHVAMDFGHVPPNFKNESYRDFLIKLKKVPLRTLNSVNCDNLVDIKKILNYGILNKNILMHVNVMLSYPIMNPYSKKNVKEPLQLMMNIGTKCSSLDEREIVLIPKKFRLTNNSIDANIVFLKL